jgi:hypothetical protein
VVEDLVNNNIIKFLKITKNAEFFIYNTYLPSEDPIYNKIENNKVSFSFKKLSDYKDNSDISHI